MSAANRAGILAAASGMALLCVVPSAYAQSAAEEEVIVTAQRREQAITDVPASVSAMGGGELAARGVDRLDGIASVFPNVSINTGNGLRTTDITVRGISSEPNNPGIDQSVGVFVDGVYQGRPTTINTSVYDLDRVEVIRGPQGALYGRNTIAGAINFITQTPGDETAFDFAVSGGEYDALTLYAGADLVFSPQARLRVSASSQDRQGLTQNSFTGTDMDNADEVGGRVTFVLDAAPGMQLTLRADAATNRTNAGAVEVLNNGAFTGSPVADANPEDRSVAVNVDSRQDRDVWGASIQADWSIGGGELTSLTAYREYQWWNVQDNDYTILDMLSTGIGENQSQFSQELRYTSPTGGVFDYIIGAYYLHETLDTIAHATIGPDLVPPYVGGEEARINADLGVDSYAVFGQGVYHFNDAWSVTGALRYSHDEKDVTHSVQADPFEVFGSSQAARDLSRSDDEVTPSVSLNWEPAPSTLLYASFSRGYKSGGYNAFSISPSDDAEFAPEFVNSYELGYKTNSADGSLYFASSIFWLDYSDLQVNQLRNVGGIPTFTTSNAASAEAYGLELEARWRASENFSVSGAYAYLDASFNDFVDATAGGADYTGNVLPQAAEHSASIAADFRSPLSSGIDLVLHGDATYRSEIFFSPSNDADFSQDGYALLNARIGFDFGAWSLMAWGRNLTDETYALFRSGGVIDPTQQIQALGAPRTWGVELRGQF
ncbi:MAG: TonB-dependent receptor [Hyphomonadaceae bacterium]|nr:TonB-dependent receptor [Hyphomonadaceae bacterium]